MAKNKWWNSKTKNGKIIFVLSGVIVALLVIIFLMIYSIMTEYERIEPGEMGKIEKLQIEIKAVNSFLRGTGLASEYRALKANDILKTVGIENDWDSFPIPGEMTISKHVKIGEKKVFFYCLPNERLFLVYDSTIGGSSSMVISEIRLSCARKNYSSPFLLMVNKKNFYIKTKKELANLFLNNGAPYEEIVKTVDDFWQQAQERGLMVE